MHIYVRSTLPWFYLKNGYCYFKWLCQKYSTRRFLENAFSSSLTVGCTRVQTTNIKKLLESQGRDITDVRGEMLLWKKISFSNITDSRNNLMNNRYRCFPFVHKCIIVSEGVFHLMSKYFSSAIKLLNKNWIVCIDLYLNMIDCCPYERKFHISVSLWLKDYVQKSSIEALFNWIKQPTSRKWFVMQNVAVLQ